MYIFSIQHQRCHYPAIRHIIWMLVEPLMASGSGKPLTRPSAPKHLTGTQASRMDCRVWRIAWRSRQELGSGMTSRVIYANGRFVSIPDVHVQLMSMIHLWLYAHVYTYYAVSSQQTLNVTGWMCTQLIFFLLLGSHKFFPTPKTPASVQCAHPVFVTKFFYIYFVLAV